MHVMHGRGNNAVSCGFILLTGNNFPLKQFLLSLLMNFNFIEIAYAI